MKDWQKLIVKPEDSLKSVIEVISLGRCQIALVADDSMRLLGTVTDGDVRRGLLQGKTLDTPANVIMNRSFKSVSSTESHYSVLSMMRKTLLHQLPVLDNAGRVAGIFILDELINPDRCGNPVLVMAGGLGKRLLPLTNSTPKPMLKVGDKPILEIILDSFVSQGFDRFFFSVNYLSHVITDHFGDGSKWGVDIQYLEEETQLGTAGAIGLLKDHASIELDEPIIMINGDLLTRMDYVSLLDFHSRQNSIATMCVRPYQVKIPYGTVVTSKNQVVEFKEKPLVDFQVNAGIYVLNPEIMDFLGPLGPIDMPDLLETVRASGRSVSAFPLHEYWLDLGHHDELERANSEFTTQSE